MSGQARSGVSRGVGLLRTMLGGLVAIGFPSTCLICRVFLEWPLKGPICDLCWQSMPVITPLLPPLRHALRGDGGARTMWLVPCGKRSMLPLRSRVGAIRWGPEGDAPLPEVPGAIACSRDTREAGVSLDPRYGRAGCWGGGGPGATSLASSS